MLLSTVDVSDMDVAQLTPDAIEDEIAPQFANARSITVPRSVDATKQFR